MTGTPRPNRYTLVTTPTVRRQLAEELPESVAAAVLEFVTGPLLDNPHRVGKALSRPLEDRFTARRGTYRVVYRIDDHTAEVSVILVVRRRDAYRRR